MVEIKAIDLLQITLYVIIIVGVVTLLKGRLPYLRKRINIGSIILLDLAMGLLFIGVGGLMITALWARLMGIFDVGEGLLHVLQRFLWTASAIITSLGLWFWVLIDVEDLYGVPFNIKRRKIEGVVSNEQRAGQPDQEIGTEPERSE